MIKIPKRHVKGLAKLASLSNESLNDIATPLSRLRPVADTRDIVTAVASHSTTAGDLREIIRALVSLHSVRDQSESIDKFMADFSAAIDASEYEELHLQPAIKKQLNERVTQLLSLGAFAVAAKAVDLRWEYDNVFCNARILTDMRPVYGIDPTKKPPAALLTHTLKLSYHHGNDLKQLYVAMTETEIAGLRKLLARADTKAKSLRQGLDEARIPVVTPHHEEEK